MWERIVIEGEEDYHDLSNIGKMTKRLLERCGKDGDEINKIVSEITDMILYGLPYTEEDVEELDKATGFCGND